MELLYTYIKGIGSCFENDEFTFSNEYFITYDKNTKKITINKNKNYKYKDFLVVKLDLLILQLGKMVQENNFIRITRFTKIGEKAKV